MAQEMQDSVFALDDQDRDLDAYCYWEAYREVVHVLDEVLPDGPELLGALVVHRDDLDAPEVQMDEKNVPDGPVNDLEVHLDDLVVDVTEMEALPAVDNPCYFVNKDLHEEDRHG